MTIFWRTDVADWLIHQQRLANENGALPVAPKPGFGSLRVGFRSRAVVNLAIAFCLVAALPAFLGACSPDESPEADVDSDGIVDSRDPYPLGQDALDTDGDSIPNVYDRTPFGNVDSDGDGVPDVYEPRAEVSPNAGGPPPVLRPPDYDGDQILDHADRYPAGQDVIDSDLDGKPDAYDLDPYGQEQLKDSDGDFIPDRRDEEPNLDDFGDADGDGYTNHYDPRPHTDDDWDRDGHRDSADLDPYDSEEN
jgi:hypothetical protein